MPSNEVLICANATDDNKRLDVFAAENVENLSRNGAAVLIEKGMLTVNGALKAKNYRVKSGDCVAIELLEPQNVDIVPENIPLDIVFEDEFLLVVNKPKGMVVHPAPSHYSGTLVNALMFHCADSLSGINGEMRPGIVHRIDMNTSGLLVVAKSDAAHFGLAEQIKAHSFTREYEALAVGKFKDLSGTVDAPIGRHKIDRKKMCVTDLNSRNAVTHFEVLRQFEKFAHLRLRLETGRTHQIRVHMAYIGHPIYGDDVYGKAVKGLQGQALHARKIGFVHPITNEYLEFSSDLPDYFKKLINA